MAHLKVVKVFDEPSTQKELLQFRIRQLSPDIKGIRRLFFILRFHYWYLTDGLFAGRP